MGKDILIMITKPNMHNICSGFSFLRKVFIFDLN